MCVAKGQLCKVCNSDLHKQDLAAPDAAAEGGGGCGRWPGTGTLAENAVRAGPLAALQPSRALGGSSLHARRSVAGADLLLHQADQL